MLLRDLFGAIGCFGFQPDVGQSTRFLERLFCPWQLKLALPCIGGFQCNDESTQLSGSAFGEGLLLGRLASFGFQPGAIV